ncbi:MAG: S9 family peptidase [Geodermatophilaceae bacterium]|nr:S9 family peptidase [Geodermatophilaceae bacterium]
MSASDSESPRPSVQEGPDHRDHPAGDPTRAGAAFASLTEFVGLARLAGLALSPEGDRLVTTVATLGPDRSKKLDALWSVDPDGQAAPRRLTRSKESAANPVFAPDGDLVFTSARRDPDADDDGGPVGPESAVWALPAAGGEARLLSTHPGGVTSLRVAAEAGTVLLGVSGQPGVDSADDEAARREARRKAGVTGVLFEEYPVRHWDHDLGPGRGRLLRADDVDQQTGTEDRLTATDVTPRTPLVQDVDDMALSRDGRQIVAGVEVSAPGGGRAQRLDIRAVDGSWRTLAEEVGADLADPAFSPDGAAVVCVRASLSTFDEPGDQTLWLVDVDTGSGRDLTPDFDGWPAHPTWSTAGDAVFFSCDQNGHHPLFRVDLADGAITRLTAGGAFTDLQVHPDGEVLFALRSAVDCPPGPVRLDAHAADQTPVALAHPGEITDLPGTLHEVETTAADGSRVRSWLVLPHGAGPEHPAPLLLWIHGGPLMSWNAWSWRWNPWLMAARGYAVLLPDPALSAGYGQDFVRRGWGAWGGSPFTDLMAATDAAQSRPDIDATRTAAMGGSFGGYMANWIAGHTDRFRAIVTHASLWHLDQFSGTTDSATYWAREFGDPLGQPQRYVDNSPHRSVENIRTPMLVIHGDKDYRVPIGEGLHLWYDLQRHGVTSKFLYFPNENHWVLSPGNAVLWYETVLAFLAEHVLDQPWQRPNLV